MEDHAAVVAELEECGRLAPEGECATCDTYRKEGWFHEPGHTPLSSCRSGARPHCTCDACY